MRKAVKGKEKRGAAVAKAPATKKLSEIEETLLKAISERVVSNGSEPGMVLSWLRSRQCFYGSVVKYEGYNGRDKKVLFAKQAPTIIELIRSLAEELVKESELDRLRRVL